MIFFNATNREHLTGCITHYGNVINIEVREVDYVIDYRARKWFRLVGAKKTCFIQREEAQNLDLAAAAGDVCGRRLSVLIDISGTVLAVKIGRRTVLDRRIVSASCPTRRPS